MTEQIGRVLGGRYRLLSPLGSGASAEVYVADDVRLHRRVAMKLLHPALGTDDTFLRRFRAETRAVAALSHPNILAVYDWSDEDQPYVVTEYLEGGSLRTMLDASHRLSPSQALVVGLQAAQALDVAHRQGFVHRGLKPANLLFGGDGRLRIADFGLAGAVAEASLTEPAGAITGAARYSSPEEARGEPLTGHSDVYSLALVLIEAVTGKVPFATGTTSATLAARLDQPVDVPEEMKALSPALTKAGATTASERPDAAELVSELMSAATQLPRPADLPLVGTADLRKPAGEMADQTMVGTAGSAIQGPPLPGAPPGPDHPVTAQQPAIAGGPGPDAPAVGPPLPAPADLAGTQPAPTGPDGRHLAAPPPPPKRSGRRPLLPGWAIPTLVVVFALVVGAGGAWFLREASLPAHEVPDALIGSHISEIDTHIGSYGWRIDRVEEYADGTEAGEILRTQPEPGTNLREGEELGVVVSLGPTLVDLPNGLKGLPVEEAEERLADAELESEVELQAHDTVPEGRVIGVADDAEQAPKGSTVVLLVSDGRASIVPDVTGWMWNDAREELEDLDLEPRRERVSNGEFGRGQVVGTDPEAGTSLEPGSEVTVYVSRNGGGNGIDTGGQVQVPFVWGKTIGDAIDEIEAAGLDVGEVDGSDNEIVLSQNPMGGTNVNEGTRVDLYAGF